MRRISDPIGKACRVLLAAGLMVLLPLEAIATTYYVRQTVGDDSHDGTSPQTEALAAHAGRRHAVGRAWSLPALTST